jgi:hypothetical protein
MRGEGKGGMRPESWLRELQNKARLVCLKKPLNYQYMDLRLRQLIQARRRGKELDWECGCLCVRVYTEINSETRSI